MWNNVIKTDKIRAVRKLGMLAVTFANIQVFWVYKSGN